MAKKDRGWEFLSNTEWGPIHDDGTGDTGYMYSDGSADYHGADGSWGYKESDGTGYYHGADGSWGYTEPDGTGYYHGADGSWGSIDADGNNYYSESDRNCDTGEDSNENDFSTAEALGTLLGYGVGGIIIARRKKQQREEEREAERKKAEIENAIRVERMKKWTKRHKRLIIAVLSVLVSLVLSMTFYTQMESRILMKVSEDELKGLKYIEVVQKLKESGFSNIHTKEISDLTISREAEADLVTDVNLRFLNSFDDNTLYPSGMRIEVVYHTVELYNPPMTHKMAKGGPALIMV